MSQIKDCLIEFKDKRTVFAPGEKVFGKIYIEFTDKVLCGRIEVTFRGQTQVEWHEPIEGKPLPNQPKEIKFSAETVYYNEKINAWIYVEEEGDPTKRRAYSKAQISTDIARKQDIWIHSSRVDKTECLPGIRGAVGAKVGDRAKVKGDMLSFDFSFALPADLPSSFYSKESPASIRYFVEVSLAGFFQDVKPKRGFLTVVAPAPISKLPGAFETVLKQATFEMRKQKMSIGRIGHQQSVDSVGGGGGLRRTLSITASLPKKGFTLGESIPVSIKLLNETHKTVKTLRVQLNQIVVCFAEKPTHKQNVAVLPIAFVSKTLKKSKKQKTPSLASIPDDPAPPANETPTAAALIDKDFTSRRSNSVIAKLPQPVNKMRMFRRGMSLSEGPTSPLPPSEPLGHEKPRKMSTGQRIVGMIRQASKIEEDGELEEELNIYVPTITPSQTIDLVSVSYSLSVQAFLHRDQPASVEVELPILIGTSETKVGLEPSFDALAVAQRTRAVSAQSQLSTTSEDLNEECVTNL